jgi:hypothetical protein
MSINRSLIRSIFSFFCCFILASTVTGHAVVAQAFLADPVALMVQDSVRQGDPLFVQAETERPLKGSIIRLRYADGSASPAFPVYFPAQLARASDVAQLRYGGPPWQLSRGTVFDRLPVPHLPGLTEPPLVLNAWLVGIHPDAVPGLATISVINAQGIELAVGSIYVMGRRYISEDIRLSPSLTSVRADPDPIKDAQAKRYHELLARVDPSAVYLDAPFIKPLASNRRTSFFGDRRRFLYSTGVTATSMHAGVDYGVPIGTPLQAAGRGRVVMAEDRIVTGRTVALEHLPGVYSIYMHMDDIAVQVGDIVPRGWFIGHSGVSGLATGPHLHWELRINQVPVDPEAMIGIDNFPKMVTIFGTIEGR